MEFPLLVTFVESPVIRCLAGNLEGTPFIVIGKKDGVVAERASSRCQDADIGYSVRTEHGVYVRFDAEPVSSHCSVGRVCGEGWSKDETEEEGEE
jgi:hypothetical protein